MTEFEIGFSKNQVQGGINECFEVVYNHSRVTGSNGELAFGQNALYFFFTDEMAKGFMKPWSVNYSEIASYEKSGLAGYLIHLKDGNVLRFSNVFRKKRNEINEALQKRGI